MTKLKPLSIVRREVSARHDNGRPFIITLRGSVVGIRLKGTRKEFQLPYSLLYLKGAQAERIRIDKEKKAARKRKKLVRRGALI